MSLVVYLADDSCEFQALVSLTDDEKYFRSSASVLIGAITFNLLLHVNC